MDGTHLRGNQYEVLLFEYPMELQSSGRVLLFVIVHSFRTVVISVSLQMTR
jgi:hypothetical protein